MDFSQISVIAGGFQGIFILFTCLYANLVKKLTNKLKITNLILARYSYKGGDNNLSLKYKGIFQDFQSGVTTVKMQAPG